MPRYRALAAVVLCVAVLGGQEPPRSSETGRRIIDRPDARRLFDPVCASLYRRAADTHRARRCIQQCQIPACREPDRTGALGSAVGTTSEPFRHRGQRVVGSVLEAGDQRGGLFVAQASRRRGAQRIPVNALSFTVGDALKTKNHKSRVVGVSLKDAQRFSWRAASLTPRIGTKPQAEIS